jgi:predicted dienelactone hydrolase
MFRVAFAFAAALVPVLAQQDGPIPFVLPAPTGPQAVGTTSWTLVDADREETFRPGSRRQVRVQAWYPAVQGSGGTLAPYLAEGPSDARTLGALMRSPGSYDALGGVATHARLDAPPAPVPEHLPLLVFSHGYIGSPGAHTALVEELASHSYVVLSVLHPYEATAATLADGSVVTPMDESGGMRRPIADVLGEWSTEDETISRVGQRVDEEEQRRLLRGYLSGLPRTNAVLRRWVDDTRLVLDRLAMAAPGSIQSRLAARADHARIGALGHSMGGVTAGQFCLEDRRCRAVLNLDGIPQYGSMIDNGLGKPLLMMYSARPGRVGASDAIYRRAASPYFRVDVRDTLHLDFTDMPLWGGPLGARGAFGTLPAARSTELTRAIVREFFDQILFGTGSPLLAGARLFPEVEVWTRR